HTRLQGDWSSDVCSSDLDRYLLVLLVPALVLRRARRYLLDFVPFAVLMLVYQECRGLAHTLHSHPYYLPQLDAYKFLFGGHVPKIGRASCRERVEISVGC